MENENYTFWRKDTFSQKKKGGIFTSKKVYPNDDIFQILGNYQVVDINIWSNKTMDDIPDLPAYDQVRKYYKIISDYWKKIYDVLGAIIDDKNNNYTKNLSDLYAKARCDFAEKK